MATVNQADEYIKLIEREIRDLKTAYKVKSNIITYEMEFDITGGSLYAPPHLYRVTYETGTQPIISFVSDVASIMGPETTNTQLIITPSLFAPTTATLVSTRPIQSIVMIS